MEKESDNQIKQWLKKLEQESWQLELLVSAFTIFLLIQAISSFSAYLLKMNYLYNLSDSLLPIVYVFLILLRLSITTLTIFLVIHLLLRGFWIGAIGLRSVQSTIDFDRLNYSRYFTEKIKKRVISLDNLVILLDEICSLIFSFAFLLMSVIISFGLFNAFLGVTAFLLNTTLGALPDSMSGLALVLGVGITLAIIISGLIYFIDYITLGFFKKFQWLSRIYYPIYRFYGVITLAVISRSTYYYLISKFSKKRIRIAYLVVGVIALFTSIVGFDQHQYYPEKSNRLVLVSNRFDNLRQEDKFIETASIQSNVISERYIQLFIRYDARNNEKIRSNCPEFIPLKEDGFDWRFNIVTTEKGFLIKGNSYEGENLDELLNCLTGVFELNLNGNVLQNQKFYFFTHPVTEQKGILTMIDASGIPEGENHLEINTVALDSAGSIQRELYSQIPFWVAAEQSK